MNPLPTLVAVVQQWSGNGANSIAFDSVSIYGSALLRYDTDASLDRGGSSPWYRYGGARRERL
jgi:hypothetical protein